MNVEQIQKINNLALELMKKGLAPDREAAVAQAEQVFKQQRAEDFTGIRERLEEVQGQQRKGSDASGGSDLAPDKVKDILEQNTRFLVKTIKEFQEKIEKLEKDMSRLRLDMVSQGPRIKELASSEVPLPREIEQAAAKQEQPRGIPAAPAKTEQKPHPRTGSFVESEVSIEKFFYMGRK